MTIDVDAVRNWRFPELRQSYTARDTILYGLALGYGSDPAREDELRFVFEKNLVAMPTMAVTLCHPGFWIGDPATGIDATKVLHGEQHCVFHRPLQPAGTLVGRVRVIAITDKGRGKGALVVTERTLSDAQTGVLVATLEQRTLCRGDGGFEGRAEAMATTPAAAMANGDRPPVPRAVAGTQAASAAPDHVVDLPTSAQAALLYRQISDLNPLHADPAVAKAAGFARPLLHGLCSYGIAARAVVRACGEGNPAVLKSLGVRFSAPFYPGETLRTQVWRDGPSVRFQCFALERNVVVMSGGNAELTQ